MRRYLPLAAPSIAAVSIACLMVLGWHVTDLIEPEDLRTAVRVVASGVWITVAIGVIVTKGDVIFGGGGHG